MSNAFDDVSKNQNNNNDNINHMNSYNNKLKTKNKSVAPLSLPILDILKDNGIVSAPALSQTASARLRSYHEPITRVVHPSHFVVSPPSSKKPQNTAPSSARVHRPNASHVTTDTSTNRRLRFEWPRGRTHLSTQQLCRRSSSCVTATTTAAPLRVTSAAAQRRANEIALQRLEKVNVRREQYTLMPTIDLGAVNVAEVRALQQTVVNGVYEVTTSITLDVGQLGLVCALLANDPNVTELDCDFATIDRFAAKALLETVQKNPRIIRVTTSEVTCIRDADRKVLNDAAENNLQRHYEHQKLKTQALNMKRQALLQKEEKEAQAVARKFDLVHRSQRNDLEQNETKRRSHILSLMEDWYHDFF
eukprot:PhM_4_TR18066/c0_g1_i1/m.101831